jgi:putative restriction endonuclease
MQPELFGEIPGHPVGSTFPDRASLFGAGLHRQMQAGIAGAAKNGGAQSIVLSGGYEDDKDLGDVIIYTGQGGQENGRQVADQELKLGNLALCRNHLTGLPVRVVRGSRHRSPYSPVSGYRYDGLYQVADAWQERGRSGFTVWRYRLERIAADAPLHAGPAPTAAGNAAPGRRETWTTRTVRDSRVSAFVKAIHDDTCQVCGLRLETPGGAYSEGAHIRPLGRPHNGPDQPDNVLCLCPNHHVLFDAGAFAIHPDTLELVGIVGELRTHRRHPVGREHLEYRIGMFGRFAGRWQPTRSPVESHVPLV